MEPGRPRQRRSASIGQAAEDRALQELRAAGLQLVTRNFRCRLGEIDLVMRDGKQLVFVEVRARSNPAFGTAAESISTAKRRRLRASAGVFLARHPQLQHHQTRFDLYAVDGSPGTGTPAATWIRGILG